MARNIGGCVLVAFVFLSRLLSADDLRSDLLVYAPLDGDLQCWTGSGIVTRADFSRPTVATTRDLQRVAEGQPRYVPGRFGQAVYIEPGGADVARGVRNILRPEQADPEGETSGFEPGPETRLEVRAPGLAGERALKVAAPARGGGFATAGVAAPRVMRYIGSVYLRGEKGGERVRLTLRDRAAGVESEPSEATLTTSWQRAFCVLPIDERKETLGEKKVESLPALQLVVTYAGDDPATFFADALMVEQSGIFYVNALSPTSWLPGLYAREHERLSLPFNRETFNPDEGTVAFWVRPDDFSGARCFFSVGANHFFPWGVNLWNKGLGFGGRDAWQYIPKWKELGLQPEQWTHVALTWTKERVRLYLNGSQAGEGPCNDEKFDVRRLSVEELTIGMGGYAHPGWSWNQFAKGALDEFLILKRALRPEEIAALAAAQKPLDLRTPVAVEVALPVRVLGREHETFALPVRLTNETGERLTDVCATLVVAGDSVERKIPVLGARESKDVSFVISPAHLREGSYVVETRLTANGLAEHRGRFTLDIGPFKNWDRLQVMTWRYGGAPDLDETLRRHGVTMAGSFSPFGTEANSRAGMFSQWSVFETGAPDPADPLQFIVGLRGQRTEKALLDHPAVRARAVAHGEEAGRRLAGHPGCRTVIINTEWETSLDFSEAGRRLVQERFGVDLMPWMQEKKDDGVVLLPFNRLNPRLGDQRWMPRDGIVSPDNGLYRFHRWWHTQAGLVPHNETLAAGIRKCCPEIQAIQEPILRCPPIKRFSKMDIAEEWVYYPDPKDMVAVQEGLNAVCRGTGMRPTGMPQFLFKPGMAAPFGATPPPELLREAVWLCCSQPIRHMVFWNFEAALFQGKQADLATVHKRFAGMDWKTAEKNLKVTGPESRDVHLWHPGTAPEFKRLSETLWEPFGALIIRWQNAPRKMAVINSFAASLFSGERWYSHGWLGKAIAETGLPYDILYDEDFAENPKALAGYDVVFAPVACALTEAAVKQLRRFIAEGKTVIADERFGVSLEGVTRLEPEQSEEAKARQQAEQEEIQREIEKLGAQAPQNAPVVVEAAQTAAQGRWRSLGRHEGLARLLQQKLRLAVEPLTPDVVINLLQAGGADYLVAVNDRRGLGPYLGQWQRCREQGVVQRTRFRISRSLGFAAYDLTRNCPLPLRPQGESFLVDVDLPPCGGAIVGLYPEAVGKLTLAATPDAARGKNAAIDVRLDGSSGKPFTGMVPVRVEIKEPDGARSSFSRCGVIENGRLVVSVPMAVNDPTGRWTTTAQELASGQTAETGWSVR